MPVRALRFLQRLAILLPRRVGLAIAALIGDLCYLFLRRTRRLAMQNMQRVLAYTSPTDPPKAVDPAHLRRTVRRSFRNQVCNYLDLMRLPAQSTDQINQLLKVVHYEYAEQALAQGRGMILFTCHLGLMDYGPLALVLRGHRVIVPVEQMKNKDLYTFLSEIRTSKGYELITSEPRALRHLLKGLRDNAVIALVSDRDFTKSGVPVMFFGAQTTMPVGLAALALRTRAPVVFAFCIRQPDTSYVATVSPPLYFDDLPGDDFEANVAVVMQQIANLFEKVIQQHPEHWAAFNTIWHT